MNGSILKVGFSRRDARACLLDPSQIALLQNFGILRAAVAVKSRRLSRTCFTSFLSGEPSRRINHSKHVITSSKRVQ